MRAEDLEELLAQADSIEPSSRFAPAVMAAVRRIQREGASVRFPWPWLGAGLAAAVGVAALGAVLLSHADVSGVDLPRGLQGLARAAPTLAEGALAALLGRGLSRLPRAFTED
jgi:hypothetical protein